MGRRLRIAKGKLEHNLGRVDLHDFVRKRDGVLAVAATWHYENLAVAPKPTRCVPAALGSIESTAPIFALSDRHRSEIPSVAIRLEMPQEHLVEEWNLSQAIEQRLELRVNRTYS